ncbi:unnamed protein product [Mytilus edulis]|uniref:Uncharacterized protein n=1 Tax=Mytilus edulis TaxID=6550 RepID=A0A8S3RQW2_MYTED|nr:unnamed protein product [Mytilus edulis]
MQTNGINNKDYSSINQQIREECQASENILKGDNQTLHCWKPKAINQSTDLSLAKRSKPEYTKTKNLEASLQQQSFRPIYQPCHFNHFQRSILHLLVLYMTRMPSHLHIRPMHPYWPGSPQLVPTHQLHLHRPLQSQMPPHVWNIPPPNYQYRQQTTDTSNKTALNASKLARCKFKYGQESVKTSTVVLNTN